MASRSDLLSNRGLHVGIEAEQITRVILVLDSYQAVIVAAVVPVDHDLCLFLHVIDIETSRVRFDPIPDLSDIGNVLRSICLLRPAHDTEYVVLGLTLREGRGILRYTTNGSTGLLEIHHVGPVRMRFEHVEHVIHKLRRDDSRETGFQLACVAWIKVVAHFLDQVVVQYPYIIDKEFAGFANRCQQSICLIMRSGITEIQGDAGTIAPIGK